jgi:hypothetical protein
VANHVTLAVIGNPTGIEKKASGREQNRRTGRWARTHQRDALSYRLEEVSIQTALTLKQAFSVYALSGSGPKASRRAWWTAERHQPGVTRACQRRPCLFFL